MSKNIWTVKTLIKKTIFMDIVFLFLIFIWDEYVLRLGVALVFFHLILFTFSRGRSRTL